MPQCPQCPLSVASGTSWGGVCPTPSVLTPEDGDPGFRAGHPNCFPMASEQEGKQPCGCAGLNFVPREVWPCPNPRIHQDKDDLIRKQGLCSRAG